ncbi:MAG: hypothetical protein ABSA84_01645 [Gammaproteobacteria bacterium]
MGRQLKDSRIETREARLKLKQRHEPYWRLIHPGCHLLSQRSIRRCMDVTSFKKQ